METVKPFPSAVLLCIVRIKIKLKVLGKAECAGEPLREHKHWAGVGIQPFLGEGLCSPALAGLCQL